MTTSPTHSTSSAPSELLGSTTPRLWTPPLRELTPETSTGSTSSTSPATSLGTPLDPWEEWAAIHVRRAARRTAGRGSGPC